MYNIYIYIYIYIYIHTVLLRNNLIKTVGKTRSFCGSAAVALRSLVNFWWENQ